MPKTYNKSPQAKWANCHICEKRKITWWQQRGVTNPEWIRICADCQHLIYKRNLRTPKPKNQLDLFAK